MLLIRKGQEPASLTSYKKLEYATYSDCNKVDIRNSLLTEQGYLCAYCMRRIRENTTKIEHWYPESKLSEAGKLDYSNMLGVCSGHRDGLSGRDDTCDARKGDSVITVDPRKEDHIRKIRYKNNGEIDSDDPVFRQDLQETLNLNCRKQFLPQNRKAVLDEVIHVLHQRNRNGAWTETDIKPIQKIYHESTQGERKEFAGIVVWYLNKIASRAKS